MKDDVQFKVPNIILKILIHLDAVLNFDGKLKGDLATHF
jgi:hypothetical protein